MNSSAARSQPTTTQERPSDQGFTLVELVAAIAMIGLVGAVVAAAITVVLSTENGVVRLGAESHDTQQGVNYFPLDVQAGPTAFAAYDTSATTAGCNAEGVNVLTFDKGTRRVSYRLTTTGGTAVLDRYTCELVAGVPDTSTIVRLNIADSLDASAGTAATAVPIADASDSSLIDTVELTLRQDGSDASVTASPRAEPRDSPGDCQSNNPIEASHGYGEFVEGDVRLVSGSITGWLGLGGTLRWESDITIASENMSAVNPAFGLYANGIDWLGDGVAPAEVLTVGKGGDIALGTSYSRTGDDVYEAPASPDNYIHLDGPGNPTVSPATAIGFPDDFDELRDCSAQLARLLDLCAASACANEVTATATGSTVRLCTSGPKPQVLNLPEAYWDGTYSFTTGSGGCQGFSQSRPLIINVIDTNGDGLVTIATAPVAWTALGDRKNILVNFPDSTHVVVQNGFHGQLLAPFAFVETTGDFDGGLIAASWTHHSGTMTSDDDLYDNPITWP